MPPCPTLLQSVRPLLLPAHRVFSALRSLQIAVRGASLSRFVRYVRRVVRVTSVIRVRYTITDPPSIVASLRSPLWVCRIHEGRGPFTFTFTFNVDHSSGACSFQNSNRWRPSMNASHTTMPNVQILALPHDARVNPSTPSARCSSIRIPI